MSSSEQAQFWAGEFGKEYIERNRSEELHSANLAFFAEVISKMSQKPKSVLEFGANIGMNYRALSALCTGLQFTGVEVNEIAARQLQLTGATSVHSSIEDFQPDEVYDLSFTKGVLIHLNPVSLPATYVKLGSSTKKFVLIAEYFNPVPLAIDYRGFSDRLFKRDFGGEFQVAQPNFELVGTGFSPNWGPFPQDNLTWWLFRKLR